MRLCLRNDGGTLVDYPDDPRLRWCDRCSHKYTKELEDGVISSTWDALRLGYQPLVGWGYGRGRLSMAKDTLVTTWNAEYV